jgi:selenocysteine-specific elongation factor
MFIIGTAGHIDHGKSSLINRLTGIDPDRLPEEKQRGMTIDLGFAWYDTADGQRIGIVDVPGHERFVLNMIAGAGGIDAVMLIVAADDGWMPQSQEHLQITKLLGIKHGIVVITKIDLVEESWVDLVTEEIKDKLKGSFLKNAPIVKLSSTTGKGFEVLKAEIERLSKSIISRENIGKPRLYIDRSFVLAGMGGVATGTLKGGVLRVGQEVSVFPARQKGKIRTLQSHNIQVETAYPGQRTAVSLTGIDKDHFTRGNLLTIPEIADSYPSNIILTLSLSVIEESKVIIEDRRKLLMILGTTEVEGELRLYQSERLFPGENGVAFFKAFGPILAFIGDRFIVRLPTPQITIGGGMILDILDVLPRHRDANKYKYLFERINLDIYTLINSSFDQKPFLDRERDFLFCNYSKEAIKFAFDEMVRLKKCNFHNGKYYRSDDLHDKIKNISKRLNEFLTGHPHYDGLPIDEIATIVQISIPQLEPVVQLMIESGQLVKKKNRFDLAGRTITVQGELKSMAEALSKEILRASFMPPTVSEIVGSDKLKREAMEYLIASGEIIKIGGGFLIHKDIWMSIIKEIKNIISSDQTLSISFLREKLNSSRKYVVPILEEIDRIGITIRQGDIRIKGVNYDKI